MPALKSSLYDMSYNPYICHRGIYWEGLSSDQWSGCWGSKADLWLSCVPAPSSQFICMQLEQLLQEVLVGAATALRRKLCLGNSLPATSNSDMLCPYAWAAPIHMLNCGVMQAGDDCAPWSAPLHFAEGVSDHSPDDCQFLSTDGQVGGECANTLDTIRNISSILTGFASVGGGGLVVLLSWLI